MMHRSLVLSLAFAAVVLPGFSQQQTQQPQPASNQIEPLSVLAVPAGYRYDPHGRRDPFVNPIPKPVKDEAAAAAPVARPLGLKGVLLADAKLLGVVTSREPSMNKIILQAPGNKTYFAAPGDSLFDATVKEIQPDAVVFAMMSPPNTPNAQQTARRDVVRKVHPVTGENK